MKDVKSPAGSLRAERATITRDRIAQSARSLFAGRGYAATTLLAISVDAGVAVQTVYAVFGSKANILRTLLQALIDDPLADAAFRAALGAPAPFEALGHFSHSIRLRWQAGHDIVLILGDAASADPALRAALNDALAARRRGIGELALSLAGRDTGFANEARTSAVIDALTVPEVYGRLVGAHGWNPDEYEAWLATALRRMVAESGQDTELAG